MRPRSYTQTKNSLLQRVGTLGPVLSAVDFVVDVHGVRAKQWEIVWCVVLQRVNFCFLDWPHWKRFFVVPLSLLPVVHSRQIALVAKRQTGGWSIEKRSRARLGAVHGSFFVGFLFFKPSARKKFKIATNKKYLVRAIFFKNQKNLSDAKYLQKKNVGSPGLR